MITIPDDYAEVIEELRHEFGLSQAQFANEIGVRQSSVSQWENGKQRPYHRVWSKILKWRQIKMTTSGTVEPKMLTHLKIKVKSLRYEVKIIQKEAKRWKEKRFGDGERHPIYRSLTLHWLPLVQELEAAIIALKFFRGKSPDEVLKKFWYHPIDWVAVEHHVDRFGNGYRNRQPIDKRQTMQHFGAWKAEADNYYNAAACIRRRQEKDRHRTLRKQSYRLRRHIGQEDELSVREDIRRAWYKQHRERRLAASAVAMIRIDE